MANTFAPKMEDTGFVPSAPPVDQGGSALSDSIGGAASLLQALNSALPTTKAPSEGALKNAARRTLASDLKKAEAYAAAGDPKRAEVTISTAKSNYFSNGYERDDWFENLTQDFQLGNQGAGVNFVNPQADMLKAAMKDQAYLPAYAAVSLSNPNLPEADRLDAAVQKMYFLKGLEFQVESAKTYGAHNWEAEERSTYESGFTEIVNSTIGALKIKEEKDGQVVTADDIIAARLRFTDYKRKFSRPPNITDDQWQPIQDKYDATEELFTKLVNLPEDRLGMMKSAELSKLVQYISNQDVSPIVKVLFMEDPAALTPHVNRLLQDSVQFLAKVTKEDTQDLNFFGGPTTSVATPRTASPTQVQDDLWTPGINEKIKTVTPKEIEAQTKVMKLFELDSVIKGTPAQRKNFEDGTAILAKQLSVASGRMGAQYLNDILSTKTMGIINALDKADPEMASRIRQRFAVGLDNQSTYQQTYLTGITEKTFFEVGSNGASITVDKTDLKASMPTEKFAALDKVVQEKYNGDYDRFYRDPMGRQYALATNLLTNDDIKFSEFGEAQQAMRVMNIIQGILGKFTQSEDAKTPNKTEEGTPKSGGSPSGDNTF